MISLSNFLGAFKIDLCMYYFKRVLLHIDDNKNDARCRQWCCRLEYNEPLCVMPHNTMINTKSQLCNVDCCWFGKPEEIMCFLLWKYFTSIAYSKHWLGSGYLKMGKNGKVRFVFSLLIWLEFYTYSIILNRYLIYMYL